MCVSQYGILARVRDGLFEDTARDAAGHGPEIVGPLMLIVRDNPDPLAQLCAMKALAMSTLPLAAEGLHRVRALPAEGRHRTVLYVMSWSPKRIAQDCTPRLLGFRMPGDDRCPPVVLEPREVQGRGRTFYTGLECPACYGMSWDTFGETDPSGLLPASDRGLVGDVTGRICRHCGYVAHDPRLSELLAEAGLS